MSYSLAVGLFFITVFIEASRILEFAGKGGAIVLFGLLVIALALNARKLAFWKTLGGKIMPLFVAWVVVAYVANPHSAYSFPYLQGTLDGAVLFVAASLLADRADFKKLFAILAAAGLFVCALGMVWSGYRNGRFGLRGGLYGDPNYFAMGLLGMAPIIWVVLTGKEGWRKAVAGIATVVPVLLALRTASRGSLVAVAVMLAVLFFFLSIRVRIVMASATVVALVAFLAFMPASLRNQLLVAARIAPADETQPPSEAAVSVTSRETLLTTSINMTLNNPVLGVGPGNFGPTIVEFGRMQGIEWLEMNTHNSYTEISSETGLPGVVFYVLMVIFSFQSVIQVVRHTSEKGENPDVEMHKLAGGLLVSLAGTCTCMIFLSEGYSTLALFWFGLANAMHRLLPEASDEEEELVEVTPVQAG